jgi:hypothetical protein
LKDEQFRFSCSPSHALLSAGFSIETHKPQAPPATVAQMAALPTTNNNNIKKFAFLSQETVPDYRPRDSVSSEAL